MVREEGLEPFASKQRIRISVTCRECGIPHILYVNRWDLQRWKDGALIQKVMPYLSASDREILISRVCGECFDKLFKEPEPCEEPEDPYSW